MCGEFTAGKRNRAGVTLPLRVFLKLNGPILAMIEQFDSLTSLRDVYAVCSLALQYDYALYAVASS